MAIDCVRVAAPDLPEESFGDRFSALLRNSWLEYRRINETRDPSAGDVFWRELSRQALAEYGAESALEPFLDEMWRRLYGQDQDYFSLYEDSIPAIERARSLAERVIVLSNWDYSLHRILHQLGIYERFDTVFASLEEGFEKPDPRLFEIATRAHRASPQECLHVGDNPVDDLQGARDFGMRATLVDRSRENVEPPYYSNLVEAVH